MSKVYDYTKNRHPKNGYYFYPIQCYQLMVDFMKQLAYVDQEPEAEAILEAITFFTSRTNVKNNVSKICIKSTDDILCLFNMNYICFGAKEILQLFQCYNHIKDTEKACKIWLYNQHDNLGERNRFGIDKNECF